MPDIAIIDGFVTLFSSPSTLVFLFLGTTIGLLAGATPGLSASATTALLIPLTFYMEPLPALVFIYTIGKAASFGGSIPAILFNTPGTPQAAATQMEGYPLTRQGKQGKALKTAVVASAMGDTVSELILIFGAAWVAGYAARLGPPELFAVFFCAFIIIGSVIGKSIVKGLLSTLLGILLSLVGFDPITAEERYVFGIDGLSDGIGLVPLLLGTLVVSEVLMQITDRRALDDARAIAPESRNPDDHRLTWAEYKNLLPTIVRSTGYGTLIGMLPGIGASVASFVAYAEAQRVGKVDDSWGKGEIKGVAAAEAANNATSGANLIPLLSLGIPGNAVAALLAGVFVIHGIAIGPRVFIESRDLIYGLFASGLVAIGLYFLLGYFGSNIVGRMIAVIPARMIYPFIFVTSFIATFALRQSPFDLVIMVIFGIVGYLMKKWDFSIPAFIIAFILGAGAEESLRQTMLLSEGGALIFFERPIALVFFAIGLLTIGLRLRKQWKGPGKNGMPLPDEE